MFKIIIHVFQIENICINEILFECLRYNSFISKGFYCILMNIILMFKIIIHVFQIENICINEIFWMFKIIINLFQKDFIAF